MAVYRRTYKRYEGALAPERARLAAIPRYTFEDLSRSKILTRLYLGGFIWPLVCAIIIYLRYNMNAVKLFNVDFSRVINIGDGFFMSFLGFQCTLAFFMAAFVGPGLISADVANNAMPLYLSRPISRAEYVGSKLAVLLILLSMITWVPGMLLYGLQSVLEGGSWMRDNARIAGVLFFGSWIFILVVSFLALALSAWVKWRPAASALMFGTFFVAAGFGESVNYTLDTHWGNLINIGGMIGAIWQSYLGLKGPRMFMGVERGETPIWAAWVSLAAVCAVCVWLLGRKVRGCEVVR